MMLIPNLDFGGAQKSFTLIKQILEKRYDLTCVVFNKDGMRQSPFKEEVESLDVSAGNNFIEKLIALRKRIIRTRKLKEKYEVELAISFLEGADYVNYFSRVNQKEKVIFTIRGSKYHDQNIRGLSGWLRMKLFLPFVYKRGSAIVTVSQGILDEVKLLIGRSRTPLTVIENYVPTNHGSHHVSVPPLKFDFILAVARLAPEKGIDKFLTIFSELKDKYAQLKFVIVGDGPGEKEILERSNKLNLKIGREFKDDNCDIMLPGFIEDPFSKFNNAILFVLPSLHEGFPNVLLEAMANGIPVVASDCPYGPAEILTKDVNGMGVFGVLVPTLEDKPQITKRWIKDISTLIESEGTRTEYSQKGKSRIIDYSEGVISKKWYHLIESCMTLINP